MEINQIIHGDNVKVLQDYANNYFDSIVTDPPYGLNFMNKHWDYDVPTTEFWKECLRVLKPGGHLLSFFGTRTYHRGVVRIEDAGFEIRDMISWIYGSGFPKSLDISKAIDKMNGVKGKVIGISTGKGYSSQQEKNKEQGYRPYKNGLPSEYADRNITAPATPDAIKWNGWGSALKPASEIICVADKPCNNHNVLLYLVRGITNQITKELCQLQSFAKAVKKNLKLSQKDLDVGGLDIAQWIAGENINTLDILNVATDIIPFCIKENMNLNTVLLWLNILKEIYLKASTFTTETETNLITDLKILNCLPLANILNAITKGEIKQNGQELNVEIARNIFNVANVKLKLTPDVFAQDPAIYQADTLNFHPDLNPIVIARKPIEGTIAENVLKYGTGGINIDGGRIETGDNRDRVGGFRTGNNLVGQLQEKERNFIGNSAGRFPANIIFDEPAAAMLDEMSGELKSGARNGGDKFKLGRYENQDGHWGLKEGKSCEASSGGASRFFYVAKASKGERNKGLEGFEEKETNRYGDFDGTPEHSPKQNIKNSNHHPTVKPVKLMRYLVRLVTPPNGICLDPFAGSGTTGIACKLEGFNFIGIEREEEYCKIAEARINAWEIEKPDFEQLELINP